ncbi:MAG: hypothetical protein JXN62_09355 [Bacteroidales bacterium]|nr:hypothetical protein [Bacteroidales bacterium]
MKKYLISEMTVKAFLFFVLLATIISCESGAQTTLIWESDAIASNPESIVYDKTRDCCYVSNFGSNPLNGMNYNEDFITKFNLKGEVLEKKFIQNLTAPTGLCLHNDFLYIVERFGIVKYDLNNNKVDTRYRVNGPGFLNDVAVDKDGTIYLTVSDTNIIYRIRDSKVEKWIESSEFMNPNGILYDDDKIIIGVCSDNSLKAVSIPEKKIEIISTPGTGFAVIDGIRKFRDGYFISHYNGIIYFVNNKGAYREVLNTSKNEIFCADFEYIDDQQLFVIPTLKNNKIRVLKYQAVRQ